jgi:germination protein M
MLRKTTIFILVLIIALSFTACKKNNDEEPYEEIPVNALVGDSALRNTILFFEDENGYIVPTMRQIGWVEGIGKKAVENLKSDSQRNIALSEKGLLPILSMDANVTLSILDGVGVCDLNSGAIIADSAIREKNKVDAIVNTLCAFDSIDSVQLLFDGEVVENLEKGTYVGAPIFSGDINLETIADVSLGDEQKVRLYFENKNTQVLVPITRAVTADINEFTVFNELLRGPSEHSGLSNIFPEGTKLLDIKVTDENILIVNLSKEAKGLKKTPEKEKILLIIISKTFEQFDNVDNVRILIDGKAYLDSAKETMAAMQYVNIID